MNSFISRIPAGFGRMPNLRGKNTRKQKSIGRLRDVRMCLTLGIGSVLTLLGAGPTSRDWFPVEWRKTERELETFGGKDS